MKILIFSNRPEVYTQWVEPLRKDGIGVMRVQNLADAEQVLKFHGRSLDALVVHTGQGDYFANHHEWKLVPLLVADRQTASELLYKIQNKSAVQATGTHGVKNHSVTNHGVALEEVSEELSKPEQQKVKSEATSIRLREPTITFTHGKSQAQSVIESNKTVMIEPTRMFTSEATKVFSLDATRVFTAGRDVPKPEISKQEVSVVQFDDEVDQDADSLTADLNEQRTAHHPSLLTASIPVPESFPESEDEADHNTKSFEISFADESPSISMKPAPIAVVSHAAVGANDAADTVTLKNYLTLREQDVAVLTGQLRSAKEHVRHLEQQVKVERVRGIELRQVTTRHEAEIQGYDRQKRIELATYEKQVQDLSQQLQERQDQYRVLESKLKVSTEEVDKTKERVRMDIRRIRVREKELEAQLEVLKKDSSALLMARDQKITELKRKLDLLEFNMELVQEQFGKERKVSDDLKRRLKDASSAVRQAGGLLDHDS